MGRVSQLNRWRVVSDPAVVVVVLVSESRSLCTLCSFLEGRGTGGALRVGRADGGLRVRLVLTLFFFVSVFCMPPQVCIHIELFKIVLLTVEAFGSRDFPNHKFCHSIMSRTAMRSTFEFAGHVNW